MFSKLFGGSKSRSAGSASSSRSERGYPSTYGDDGVASYPTSPNGVADGSQYDEVTFGGGGDLADSALSSAGQPRPSISQDGAFVGSSSYYPPRQSVESSYPPLPSFSRPSSSASTSNRYPPLRATFARLHTLLDSNSPALLDTLSPPLAPDDPALASLQAAIAPYRLPQAVIDSYLQGHDGQDPLAYFGGSSTGGASGGASLGGLGLVYGLWWLPLDRVEEEWRFWRRLEEAGGLSAGSGLGGDAFSASASEAAKRKRHTARTHPYVPEEDARSQASTSSAVQDERGVSMQGMSSFPEGWVRKRYSHPGWLPLLTDRCGNYIGVDLDPPPPSASSGPTSPTAPGAPASSARTYGQPGQVIAFGREVDEKVVLFPGDGPGGWARFLAAFVEDLEKGEVARVGERPSDAIGGRDAKGRRARRRWSDDGDNEERGSSRDASGSSSSSGDEFDDSGDGLGERAYFETGMDGEEIFGDTPRNAQTWCVHSRTFPLSHADEAHLTGSPDPSIAVCSPSFRPKAESSPFSANAAGGNGGRSASGRLSLEQPSSSLHPVDLSPSSCLRLLSKRLMSRQSVLRGRQESRRSRSRPRPSDLRQARSDRPTSRARRTLRRRTLSPGANRLLRPFLSSSRHPLPATRHLRPNLQPAHLISCATLPTLRQTVTIPDTCATLLAPHARASSSNLANAPLLLLPHPSKSHCSPTSTSPTPFPRLRQVRDRKLRLAQAGCSQTDEREVACSAVSASALSQATPSSLSATRRRAAH
ncbi:hypothetical protein AAT19DRAFT_13324 [Rhodotorula toruloides]|uniref:Uncharacterized protein n=1 Tax=Rhodotorula toruloides TaxID=5286 RepID=A0A2T0AE79_RHOTO|nr:hypothetical protein AAT19DRAFT_13324 [Rhodotorula toruloides]